MSGDPLISHGATEAEVRRFVTEQDDAEIRRLDAELRQRGVPLWLIERAMPPTIEAVRATVDARVQQVILDMALAAGAVRVH